MTALLIRLTPLLCAAVLCQCGAPRPPTCWHVPRASRGSAPSLVGDARKAWAILGDSSYQAQWPAARDAYNAATAKLFDQLRCGPGTWETRASALGTCLSPADKRQTDPNQLDAVFPASLVNVSAVHTHQTTQGVGVPLVGWKSTTPVGVAREPFLLPNGLPYLLTATLAFDRPGAPAWHFTKRWLHDDLTIRRSSHTLAADWTAPNAFFWHMCELDDLKIQNVILPERYMQETSIYFLHPYDPEKIPLVFVHGLVSSPDAFKNMINELAPQPWFRAHYQIWLYNYPTGNPWVFSSKKFRDVMRQTCAYAGTKGPDDNLKRMVVVAHSMGGLLVRSSVTDFQTGLHDVPPKKPLGQSQVSKPPRESNQAAVPDPPLNAPRRVIFLAVPHRGSPAADYVISTWIAKLIRLPKTLTVELLDSTLLAVGDAIHGENPAQRIPTSINSLSPYSKSTIALSQLPLPTRVTFHSIMGDRGRGDTPQSSDGIVPYASAHVTPVASELIVPSNHSVPDNRAAAAELKRILLVHLKENTKS